MTRTEHIESFKRDMNEWLHSREWNPNECYPFEDMESLIIEVKEKLNPYSIVYKGYETFGETVTIGGEWPDLGMSLEINFNPIGPDSPHVFRVLYRWR